MTALLFLLTIYIYIERERECLNIHGTHVTINMFTDNNIAFFFVSNLKMVYYNHH